jgi:glycine C-acetyltransferase
MAQDRLDARLAEDLEKLRAAGTAKGAETVTTGVVPAADGRGPRYLLAGEGDKPFLRMNSNGYLGMALRPELVAAEEKASRELGVGPQAVRFISGTYEPHVELERELAAFHGRQAAMIFSSAYATIMGVLPPLVTAETAVISDELNHNCIINAIRLSRPAQRYVYPHLDYVELDAALARAAEAGATRAIVVTDGIFSMRGDHAALDTISEIVERHDPGFAENALLVVDDSHGVGACGETGRGTEEMTGVRADVLVATLGKALGVNGGYVTASEVMISHLRETAPFYIYSNPITPGEAAAARAALGILDSAEGRRLLDHLRAMTRRFERGLREAGFETLPGEHPVVPLMVRDTERTAALVARLRENGVLATGLNYPVVPRGDEEIRFQISADHSEADVDSVLEILGAAGDRDPRS